LHFAFLIFKGAFCAFDITILTNPKGEPMTNDPSMTFTSTTPAPDAPPPSMVQKIGGTIFEVSFHFSTTSQETMTDKINRLVRRDLDAS
jgi:hypothetical protein